MLKRHLTGYFVFFLCGVLQSPFLFSSSAGNGISGKSLSPARIVSINLCADELLLRLADPSAIAGVTAYPKSPEAERILKKIPSVKKIRGNAEEVVGLKPDLVLAGPYMHRETVYFLKRMGIPVLFIAVPENFEGIYENISTLASAIGEEGRGRMMIRKMKEDLGRLPQKNTRPKALFFQSGGIVPGDETFEDALMNLSGLKNFAGQTGVHHYGQMSLERLITEKPDILIFADDQTNGASVRGEVLSHPALRRGMAGAKTLVLPACLLHCGSPASVEAVKLLREGAGASGS